MQKITFDSYVTIPSGDEETEIPVTVIGEYTEEEHQTRIDPGYPAEFEIWEIWNGKEEICPSTLPSWELDRLKEEGFHYAEED